MSDRTLYDLLESDARFHARLEFMLQASLGEITPEIEAYQDEWFSNTQDIERKLASYAKVMKNLGGRIAELTASANSFQGESDRLRAQADRLDKRVEYMSSVILNYMEHMVPDPAKGPKKLEVEDFIFQANRSGNPPLEIDVPIHELPGRYITGEFKLKTTWDLAHKMMRAALDAEGLGRTIVLDAVADKNLIKQNLDDDPDLEGKAHLGVAKTRLVIK